MQDVKPVDTHVAIEGEDEHHEKKPVTMKVKERVKKLKNTITKKIRGDDHDHDHDYDYEHQRDRDLNMDEDEEEDEEEGGYLEDDEDKLVDSNPEVHGAPRGEVISSVSPIIQSFEAMSVADKPEGHAAHREAVATPPTGSHEEEHDVELEDQRDLAAPPVSTGFHDQLSLEEPLKIDEAEKQENQQSYTEKLKSAAAGTTEYGKKIASAAYDKAAVAGATVLAKVRQPQGGGGAAVDPPNRSHDQFSPENQQSYTEKLKSVAAGTTEYGKNIASVAYDKAAVAGAAVLSKVQQPQGGGAADTTGVSVREYIAEKLKPGEEDKALSEVISDAMPTRKGDRKGETEHKASEEEATLRSERRSEGEEIRHKAGEGVTGTEGWSGGETEQKESEQVISGGHTTQEKAGEEAARSDERRGGATMMEKIRGAITSVTSLISSNGTSSKSPVTNTKEKGTDADIVEGTN